MDLFNFKKKNDKAEVSKVSTSEVKKEVIKDVEETQQKGDKTIVRLGDAESIIEIIQGDFTLSINSYELLFRIDSTISNKKYRIIGIGGSLVVTEKELDYIYSEFKRYNK